MRLLSGQVTFTWSSYKVQANSLLCVLYHYHPLFIVIQRENPSCTYWSCFIQRYCLLRLTCIRLLFICKNDFVNRSPIMVHPPCPPSNIRMTSSKLDLARDIFKCVMCHERFNSLEGLTRHLKETDHSAISAAISANPDRQRHHTETSTPENSPSTFSRWVVLKCYCTWGADLSAVFCTAKLSDMNTGVDS